MSLETVHASAASTMPIAVGMHDWKTIAPVMLPMASVSLVWRTQIRLLNFSGSSVAMGAMIRASRVGSSPADFDTCSIAVDEDEGAERRSWPARRATCRLTTRSRGGLPGRAVGAPVDTLEAQRREVDRIDRRVRLEVRLDVPGVDAEHDDDHAVAQERSIPTE